MRTATKHEPQSRSAKLISPDADTYELEAISIVANSRGNVAVRLSNIRPTQYGSFKTYSIGAQSPMETTLDIEVGEDAAEHVYIGQRFRVHIEAL